MSAWWSGSVDPTGTATAAGFPNLLASRLGHELRTICFSAERGMLRAVGDGHFSTYVIVVGEIADKYLSKLPLILSNFPQNLVRLSVMST